MFLHEGDEVGFSKQLGWASLPIHHFHSAGLKSGALLIDGEELQGNTWRVQTSCPHAQFSPLHQESQAGAELQPLSLMGHPLITLSLQ